MATHSPASIQPLPPHVVAHIKSATAITSLSTVLLGLLHNALDAAATSIDATIDFARGDCALDDNGLGIPPAEFRPEGCLGKLYCTSKHNAPGPLLGCSGTFLASLAAMSLVTVTSHHYQHRSHNSVSFHHSVVVERLLPVPPSRNLDGSHGTRVSVRNLFGNMPVRVKQRSMVAEHGAEQDRLWEALKKDIVGLLLSRQPLIWLRIRDVTGKAVLIFNTTASAVHSTSQNTQVAKPRSAHLLSTLQALTQAKYIGVDKWASWVPVSASTSAMSIKGAISLEPAPTKHVQFLSLGIRPLAADSGHNELYDHINRLFASSSFGTLEEEPDVGQSEKLRRQSDRRYKSEGYSKKQLKARKGADRYPMFHFRIALSGHDVTLAGEQFVNDETNLQAVLSVLDAMIAQWLSVHHFRSSKSRKITQTETPSNTHTTESSICSSAKSESRKRKRQIMAPLHNPSETPKRHAFADWSRIKSGKSDFFTDTSSQIKPRPDSPLDTPAKTNKLSARTKEPGGSAGPYIGPLARGALNDDATTTHLSEDERQCAHVDGPDGTILWTDPSTRRTHLLNSRTGSVMQRPLLRPHTDHNASNLPITQGATCQSLRITQRPTSADPVNTPWLDGIFKTWENPIFKQSEECVHHSTPQQFESCSSKLSREGLQTAEVIAQVDRKFILIRTRSSDDDIDGVPKGQTLVLVDQHAADERIQVELLLANLCTPLADHVCSGYQSQLGLSSSVAFTSLEKPVQFTVSSQELVHFKTYAAQFAAWGILYDFLTLALTIDRASTVGKKQCLLSVTTLPPVISERCKADPQLLISFLRAAVWKYAESPHQQTPFSGSYAEKTDWVQKLATCPPGLVDLVNSRACRSAIMFNDELGLERCKELVQKLSRCTFPFMCAHGRPSMVPIGNLGSFSHATNGVGLDCTENKSTTGFVQAWKSWKR
jgi:DNA mismatch repair protein MLH3